jgi:hypothetical protein
MQQEGRLIVQVPAHRLHVDLRLIASCLCR